METNKMMTRESKKKAKDIDLKELFLVLKRHYLVIVFVTLLAGVVGYLLNQITVTPLYQSSSRVILGADSETKTMQVIVRDSSILDIVIRQLNLQETSDQLANNITVTNIENSQVISINVIDTDARRASKIADTVAEVFKEEVPKIMGQSKITMLSSAKINKSPINPPRKNMLLYGFIGGIVIGIGLAFLLETLEDTIRSKDDIESLLEVPVIGKVQKITKRNIKRKTNRSRVNLDLRGESVDFE